MVVMSKQTIVNRIQGVITNATEQDFELPIDLGNGVVGYDAIVGIDYTTSPTLLMLGFKSGVSEFLVHGVASPIAQQPVSSPRRLYVPATYKPFVRVRGGTAGDKVALFVFGYYNDDPYPVMTVSMEV